MNDGCRWLKRWKKYVSYEEIIEDKQPTQYFGGPKPFKMNEDLMDTIVSHCFKYNPMKVH